MPAQAKPARHGRAIRVLLVGGGSVVSALAALRSRALAVEAAADLASASSSPDVVIIDAGASTRALLTEAHRRWPSAPALAAVGTDLDTRAAAELLRAGAAGLLRDSDAPRRILIAVEEAVRGGAAVSPTLARGLVAGASSTEAPMSRTEALTSREAEVLQAVSSGATNREVAAALGLTRSTVRTHLENIYRKLDVTNRAEAVAEAARRAWLERVDRVDSR